MTDLVERLRARADDKFIRDAPLMREAAKEIERLRIRIADLEYKWRETQRMLR